MGLPEAWPDGFPGELTMPDFHEDRMREIEEHIKKGIATIEDLRYAFGRLKAAERTSRALVKILIKNGLVRSPIREGGTA